MGRLSGRTVVFLTSEGGVTDAELTVPWRTVEQHGGTCLLACPVPGEVRTVVDGSVPVGVYPVDVLASAITADDLDALVIPGGTNNVDALRLSADAVSLVRSVAAAGRPIATTCHGPWLLVEADGVEGKQLTSFPSLATDIRNAGAAWIDAGAVVSSERFPLLTSRHPSDLTVFCSALVDLIA